MKNAQVVVAAALRHDAKVRGKDIADELLVGTEKGIAAGIFILPPVIGILIEKTLLGERVVVVRALPALSRSASSSISSYFEGLRLPVQG